MQNQTEGLFPALEEVLKNATEPLDCHDLFDVPEVRKHAQTVNRVSDYLGGLWRKGLVVRLPAPKEDNKRSRWTYSWKGRKTRYDGPITSPTETPVGELYTPRVIADRPSVLITEEGTTITIELPNLVIVLRQKQ